MVTVVEDKVISYIISEVYNEEAGCELHRDSNQQQEDIL